MCFFSVFVLFSLNQRISPASLRPGQPGSPDPVLLSALLSCVAMPVSALPLYLYLGSKDWIQARLV